jgi:hypothetical protein
MEQNMKEDPSSAPPLVMAEARRAARIVYPENPRYQRIRFISRLMDQSIVLPNGYRIGLDPLLGLLPVVGDFLGALISCYLVYESARLGLPKRVLARMLGNIAIEAGAGSFPILGDIFDAAWKANMRNLRLVEMHYQPAAPERPTRRIGWWLAVMIGLLLAGTLAVAFVVVKLLVLLLQLLTG